MPKKSNYNHITRCCFINAPFEQLQTGLLELFLENRLQPEIGLEGNCLWKSSRTDFEQIARAFQDNNLTCTLHAPFFDLAPGGYDERIVEITREKMRRAFELIEVFKPLSIVCHLGYEANKHAGKYDKWLDTALATWREMLAVADRYNVKVMFENTYETDPAVHKQLFEELDSPNLGFCLDTGHVMAFAGSTWQLWLDALAPWLGQLHLHDNDGKGDDHIAIGRGIFNFRELFDFLGSHEFQPLITLEPHSEEDLWLSLAAIDAMNLFRNVT